uniref:Uncharacterized protein n=1 Tax=Anguilla anguilla TaxID=7936 RepID=A0A0E9VSA7_ANGAN
MIISNQLELHFELRSCRRRKGRKRKILKL